MQSDRYWNSTLFCTVVTFSKCLFRDKATIAGKTANTISVKKIACTLPLCRKEFKIQLSLRYLSGYNSASFSKTKDSFKITRAFWLRINSCIKNTHHFIQTKERDLDLNGWHSKNFAKDLLGTPISLPIIQIWGLLSPENIYGPANLVVKLKCTCFHKLIF